MTLKDYLIDLTVENKQLTAIEKADMISQFQNYKVNGFLKFSKKETRNMASDFQKQFLRDNNCAHVSKNLDGIYTITYNRYGYDIEICDTDLTRARNCFIEATYA